MTYSFETQIPKVRSWYDVNAEVNLVLTCEAVNKQKVEREGRREACALHCSYFLLRSPYSARRNELWCVVLNRLEKYEKKG